MRFPGLGIDPRFFETFTELAGRLVTSSRLLGQLFAEPTRVAELVVSIKGVEHEAARIVRELDDRLDHTLFTPIDREDVHMLAARLANVIDLIDGTAQRAELFRIGDVPENARQLSEVLVRASDHLAGAVDELRKPKGLSMHLQSVKQLEEDGDGLYQRGVAALFGGAHEPLDIIKWKELYDRLEKATDECQHTAQVVQSIALKYGGFTRGG